MNWRATLTASLILALLCAPAAAYRAGDTVRFHVIPRNLSGVPVDPTALRAYVYKGDVCIDSTKYYPSGGIAAYALASSKTARVYKWDWSVPSTTGSLASYSGVLHVVVRSITSDIGQDWLNPEPALVPINFAAVDTFRVYEIADLWNQVETTTAAVISPGNYGATAVTSGGSNVQGAIVTLHTASSGTTATVVGWALSDASGSYRIPVQVSSTGSNTFYLFARQGTRVVKSAETITVP